MRSPQARHGYSSRLLSPSRNNKPMASFSSTGEDMASRRASSCQSDRRARSNASADDLRRFERTEASAIPRQRPRPPPSWMQAEKHSPPPPDRTILRQRAADLSSSHVLLGRTSSAWKLLRRGTGIRSIAPSTRRDKSRAPRSQWRSPARPRAHRRRRANRPRAQVGSFRFDWPALQR